MRSVGRWMRLAAAGHLVRPRTWAGAQLRFQDGTCPIVFRETVRTRATTERPVAIVIQFRLAFLGSNPYLHGAFRRECILHTPLFAGFPGFRSKLWADDVRSGVYAGVYEWEGEEGARHYAERMVALLSPFSNPGTARFQVIPGQRRDDFLAGSAGGPSVGSRWFDVVVSRPAPPRHPGPG